MFGRLSGEKAIAKAWLLAEDWGTLDWMEFLLALPLNVF